MQGLLNQRLISLRMLLLFKFDGLGRLRGLVARVEVRPEVPLRTRDRHLVEGRELLVVVAVDDVVVDRVDAARAVVELREFSWGSFPRRLPGPAA